MKLNYNYLLTPMILFYVSNKYLSIEVIFIVRSKGQNSRTVSGYFSLF